MGVLSLEIAQAFNGILNCIINDISIYQCHLEASSFPLKAVLPHTNEWAVHAVDVVFYWQPAKSIFLGTSATSNTF